MEFSSASIGMKEGGGFAVDGELTIKDIAMTVTLEGRINGPITDPWGGTRIGFTATGAVNRKEFGLKWDDLLEAGGAILGDVVTIMLDGEGIQKAPA